MLMGTDAGGMDAAVPHKPPFFTRRKRVERGLRGLLIIIDEAGI